MKPSTRRHRPESDEWKKTSRGADVRVRAGARVSLAAVAIDMRERFGAGRIDLEHAVERGDLEEPENVLVRADEQQPPPDGAEPLASPHQDPQRRRIDEADAGKIDHDLLRAAPERLERPPLELRRRMEVELALEVDQEGRLPERRSLSDKLLPDEGGLRGCGHASKVKRILCKPVQVR